MKVAMEKTTFYQIEKNPHFGGYGYHLSTNILCQEQEQKKIFCENRVASIFGSFAFHYQENHNLHILIISRIILIKLATLKQLSYLRFSNG